LIGISQFEEFPIAGAGHRWAVRIIYPRSVAGRSSRARTAPVLEVSGWAGSAHRSTSSAAVIARCGGGQHVTLFRLGSHPTVGSTRPGEDRPRLSEHATEQLETEGTAWTA